MKKSKLTTKQIVLTGMMTAVLAVLSIVTIPLPTGVPVTLQTFAMAFCGSKFFASHPPVKRILIFEKSAAYAVWHIAFFCFHSKNSIMSRKKKVFFYFFTSNPYDTVPFSNTASTS